MIRNIHISNYLSCSLSRQITKVLLYCHDCVYIYWTFHNYSADSLFSPIYQGKASFIASPGQRKLVITSIHRKVFTKIGYIFTLKSDNKLLSSFGNNRLVPLTTHL